MKHSSSKIARLVIMSLAFSSLLSCSKMKIEKTVKPTYVIEGHLYKDCSYSPVGGVFLQLIQSAPNGSRFGGLLDTFVTDSTGYYKFKYQDKNGFELYIKHSKFEGANIVHDYIPQDTTILNLDIFFNPTVNIEVSLNVINPYSKDDTLQIQDFSPRAGIRIPGPFKSGFAFRIDNAYLFDMSLKKDYFSINWHLLPYRGVTFAEYFSIYEYCDNTVYVTIDVE